MCMGNDINYYLIWILKIEHHTLQDDSVNNLWSTFECCIGAQMRENCWTRVETVGPKNTWHTFYLKRFYIFWIPSEETISNLMHIFWFRSRMCWKTMKNRCNLEVNFFFSEFFLNNSCSSCSFAYAMYSLKSTVPLKKYLFAKFLVKTNWRFWQQFTRKSWSLMRFWRTFTRKSWKKIKIPGVLVSDAEEIGQIDVRNAFSIVLRIPGKKYLRKFERYVMKFMYFWLKIHQKAV